MRSLRHSSTKTIPVVVLLASVFCSAAVASSEKVVAKRSATGDYAITQVTATVKNPKRIRVRVVTSPSQKASLTWTILCSKGFSASTKDGQLNVTAPYTKTISHPMLSKASSCIVSANSQLDDSGKVTISILATKR
jgi:hypothetical protein